MEKNKRLSIVLASPYEFTKEPGGVKDFILGLREALRKDGHTVTIIAPGSKDACEKGLVNYVLGMGFKITTDQTEFRASLSRKETAGKILGAVKPDIIVIHEPFVPSIGHTIISSLTKTENNSRFPVVVGQFHARREGLNWQFKAVEFVARHLIRRPKLSGRKILGLSIGYVSTINNNLLGRIAVSKASKRFWQKKLPARYKVIYNGIDTNELTIKGPKINNWVNPTSPGLRGARIILFAGRHDRRKGIGDLISAFSMLVQSGIDDIRLKITGEGEMTKTLREMVKKLKLEKFIQFVGILPRAQLVKAYRTADLVVAPSTGGEGFNRTIIEARSCGTLVVCTDIGGQREAIGKDLFPFMAKPKDPRSLGKQIMKVLNLPEKEKREISKRGREDVESHFDWDIIAKQHLAYYKSLIAKTASQGQALRSYLRS